MTRTRSPKVPRIRELVVQYRPHASGLVVDQRSITSPELAAGIVVPLLAREPYEKLVAVHLNCRRQVLGIQEIASGSLDNAAINVRAIVAAAIGEKNSHAVIIAHNHPSGDPTPSPDDLSLTRRIAAILKLFGVELADHIIVGDQAYVSFRNTGRMEYLGNDRS